MKTPRRLKCDVNNNFKYKFLEKKQNNNKFESKTIPQTAVAGTKHTISTDTNEIIGRKLISKPLPNSFQNPLSRRGDNTRGSDGRFTQQTTFLPINTSAEEEEEEEEEEDEEEEEQAETTEHRQSTPTPNTAT